MNRVNSLYGTLHSPLFWLSLGVLFYYMGSSYMTFFFDEKLNSVFSVSGIAIMAFSLVKARGFAIPFSGTLRNVYLMFIVLTIFVIMRGFLDYNVEVAATMNIRREITNYLSPLLLLFPFLKYKQRYIFYICMLSCVLGGVFLVTQRQELFVENAVEGMGFFNWRTVSRASIANRMVIPALLYLMWRGTEKKHRILIFAVALGAVAGSLLSGRRSSSFTIVMFFVFYIITNRDLLRRRTIVIALILIAIAYNWENIVNMFSTQFEYFMGRADIDSRSPVEKDLIADMDFASWIFGRGMLGTYECPSAIDNFNRPMIETGYLQMILKGGVIYFIPYLLLLTSAAYRGIFKSNNAFTKCLGFYALAHIILLYPGGHIVLSLEHLIVWYAISVCNNRQMLKMSDKEIACIW